MEEPRTTIPASEPDGAPRAPPRELQYAGRIVLGERLGGGGMGEVHLGTDLALGRAVAVKLALVADDPDARRRFIAEARITGQLSHPGVVPVHLLAETPDGEPYFAMKRIEGEDLARRLDRIQREERSVDARRRLELLEVFLKVCDALAYAHSRGVVHRDIKPANVMVGDFGEVLVVDWGLARLGDVGDRGARKGTLAPHHGEDAPRTLDGTILGTPAYMSPEQARGDIDVVDARSDQYALGALLYHLLTLRAPFGGDVHAMLAQVIEGDFRPPSAAVPWEVPWELEAVVLRAMATAPERRYPSVEELARDVRRFLEGRNLGAVRYSARQVLTRWLARHRALASAIALAALATLASAAGAYVRVAREAEIARAALAREEGERARAEIARAQAADARDRLAVQRREVELQLATALGYKAAIANAERRTLEAAVYLAHARAIYDSPATLFGALCSRRPLAIPRHRLVGGILCQLRDGRWARRAGRTLWLDASDFTPGPSHTLGTAAGLVTIASDGTWLADTDHGRPLRIVPLAGGERVLDGAPSHPTSLEISPDSRWVATSDWGSQLMVWSTNGPKTPRVFRGAARNFRALAFSADSARLFAGWSDGEVLVIELASDATQRFRAPGPVAALAPSPDGRHVAVGLPDGRVQVWSLASRELVTELRGHAHEVHLLAYAPDSRWLASADREGALRLWNPASTELVQTLGAPRNAQALVFAADRGHIVCGSAQETWCWALPAMPPASGRSILAAHGEGRWGFVHGLAVDPHGRWFATSGDYRTIKVWDLATGALVRAGWHQLYPVTALVPAADGKHLYVGTADGTISLHALDREAPVWIHEGTSAIVDLAASPDARLVASIGADRVLEVRDGGDGGLVARVSQPAGSRGVCFSPDGHWVATPAGTWRTPRGTEGLTFDVDPRPLDPEKKTPVAFSADARWLAIGRGERIELRDGASGEVLHVLEGHGGHVQSLAFAPTLPLLVSGAFDGTLRGWDAEGGAPVGDALDLQRWPLRLAFTGDRQLLVGCGFGGVERLGHEAPADPVAAEGLAALRRTGSVLVDGAPDARWSPPLPWPRGTAPEAEPFEQAVGYRQVGRSAEAIGLLDRAIALDPDLAIAHLERGTLRMVAQQDTLALGDLERARHLADEQGRPRLARRALLALATACQALGNGDRAREYYGRLAAQASTTPVLLRRARFGLALVADPAERDRAIAAVLEDSGESTPPLFCEAVSTPRDASLADLLQEHFADHPLAAVELALYHTRMGRPLVAEEHAARARELSRPGMPHAGLWALVQRRLEGR